MRVQLKVHPSNGNAGVLARQQRLSRSTWVDEFRASGDAARLRMCSRRQSAVRNANHLERCIIYRRICRKKKRLKVASFTPQGVPILSLMPDSGFDYVEEGFISDSSFLLLLLQCRSNYKLPPCPRFSLCSPAMLNSSSPLPSASACFCSAQRKINTLVSVHWWQTSVQKQANWEIAKKRKTIRSLLLPWSWTLSSPPCCLVLPIITKKKCTGKNS